MLFFRSEEVAKSWAAGRDDVEILTPEQALQLGNLTNEYILGDAAQRADGGDA